MIVVQCAGHKTILSISRKQAESKMSSAVEGRSRRDMPTIERVCVVWLWVAGLPALAPAAPALSRFEFTQTEMAVPIRIVIYARDNATASQAARAAFLRFHELNATCSDYDPKSELRRLCDTSSEGHAVPVSDDLWRVLVRAEQAFPAVAGGVRRDRRPAGPPLAQCPAYEGTFVGRVAGRGAGAGRLSLRPSRSKAARCRVAAAEDAARPGRNRQGLRGR